METWLGGGGGGQHLCGLGGFLFPVSRTWDQAKPEYIHMRRNMYNAALLRGSLGAIFLTIQNILVEIFLTATMADRNVDKYIIVIVS